MTIPLIFSAMMLLVMLSGVYASGTCVSCGKRLSHAEDCWRRRD